MIRFIAYVTAIAAAVSLLFVVRPGSTLSALLAGLAAGMTVPLLEIVVTSGKYLRLSFYGLRYRRRLVRVSVSYLFRIKLDGDYLLIRSARFQNFIPVGGVYKVSPRAGNAFDRFSAIDDDLVAIDEVSDRDLRIRLPANRLVTFLRWFERGVERETSPWREFYEELLTDGILPTAAFPYIYHDFVKRIVMPVSFSEYAQSLELFVADIYELHPTQEQLAELRRLKAEGHKDVVWASAEQIRRRGAIPGQPYRERIGRPAEWIL
jgi:hypothetical protein